MVKRVHSVEGFLILNILLVKTKVSKLDSHCIIHKICGLSANLIQHFTDFSFEFALVEVSNSPINYQNQLTE